MQHTRFSLVAAGTRHQSVTTGTELAPIGRPNAIHRFTALACILFALALPTLSAAPAESSAAGETHRPAQSTTTSENQIDVINSTVQTLKSEVDALQIEHAKESRPWYLDVSTIIAVLSFIFAFGTTWVSSRKAKAQEIEAHRAELRGLLQRMAALPKENVEALEKYRDNPAALATISGYLNQENTFLSGQAAEIVKKLPAGRVSAVELYAIALALGYAYDLEGQRKFLLLAINSATDFNTEISAVRLNAHGLFLTGKPDTGRAEYQKALAIFDKYQGYDAYTKTYTHIKTELNWAFSESTIRAGSPLSEPHLAQAEALVATIPPSPGREQLEKEISQGRQQLRFPRPAST